MANQMIALQARAPQTDFLGNAIQRNAQMMNMMSQQRAAERQAAQAQQTMDIARAKEEREAALAKPQMEKATADAQAAQMKRASDFLDLSIAGMKMARGPEDAIKIGGWLKSQFNDPVLRDAVDQTLSSLLEPGADFEKRREEMLFQSMGAKEQLDQKFIELTSGAETWTVATPTYAGAKRAPAEVQGTRQKAPVGITYIKTDKGIVPMPKEMTGGDGGLVGGERGGDGYDVVFGFGQYGSPSKPLTSLTLGEVQDFQRNTLIPATRGKVGAGPDKGTGAVGKYQIVYSTLQEYAPKVLGANWKSQPFTPEVQERIAEAIYNDVRGGNLKNTWAGLPNNKPGEYANVPWSQVRDKVAQVESGGGGRGAARGIEIGKPVPGTGKGEKVAAEAYNAMEAAVAKYDKTIELAERLLNNPALDSITGNVQGNIPETILSLSSQDAANALSDYNALVSVAGFQELQAMRDASPTGGAIGQVSDSENKLLQQSAFASSRTQSETKFRESLRTYLKLLRESKARVEGAYERTFGNRFAPQRPSAVAPARTGTQRAPAPAAGSNIDALLKKYGG